MSTLRSESDALEKRLASLEAEAEELRKQLADSQVANALKKETESVTRALALASNIIFLRQETGTIRKDLLLDKQARQELEQQAQELGALYEPAQAELNRLLDLEPRLSAISSLSAIREPALPTSPVAPQKTRNIALAGALGVMPGVFAALFLEFYRSTAPSPAPGQ